VTARHRARATGTRRTVGAIGSGGVALLLLVAALLVGPLPAQADPGATMIRLAQLTSSPPEVDLVASSVMDPRKSIITATLRYGQVSAYRTVEPGDYVVTMRPTGSTVPPTVSKTVSVRSGAAYTVAAIQGEQTPNDLQVLTDDLAPPPPDRARVRVINATSPANPLDVRDANAQPVALGLPRGQASPYREVAPGAMRWAVGSPSAGSTVSFEVARNQVASVLLTGADAGPHATVVVDAAGPAAVPPGPVHAGFGGTAGPAPGAAFGSAVLAVLAVLAAGVSVRLARSTK
jgi:Domain of unknown function (DUF4397)